MARFQREQGTSSLLVLFLRVRGKVLNTLLFLTGILSVVYFMLASHFLSHFLARLLCNARKPVSSRSLNKLSPLYAGTKPSEFRRHR